MQIFNIGRDATNEIVLNDDLVSRHHAQLVIHDTGQAMIRDLGSSNGTFVNGNRITESYLHPGDVVKCGPVFLSWNQYVPDHPVERNRPDFTTVANKAKEWNNLFISFIRPFLATIDSGAFFRKVFSWIYVIIAILNILLPVYVLFKAIDEGIFSEEGKAVFTFLILWLAFALLCWFGFQLWWNRREKVIQSSYSGAEFAATPVLAHFIQTIGEWYGIIVGVLGFLSGLLSLLFGYEDRYGRNDFPMLLGDLGWSLIFLGPVIGFFIVFLFRFLSEAIKVLAVIANNTKSGK